MTKKRRVNNPSELVNTLVKQIRRIHSPRDAKRLLGWSYRRLGIEIGERTEGRNLKPYSKAMMVRMCLRTNDRWYLKCNSAQLTAWARVLDEYVLLQDQTMRFQMTVHSPWQCWIEHRDDKGKWHKVDLRERRWRKP